MTEMKTNQATDNMTGISAMTETKKPRVKKSVVRVFVLVLVASCFCGLRSTSLASAAEQPAAQKTDQNSNDQPAKADSAGDKSISVQPSATKDATPADHQPKSLAGALAKETRISEGEEEEEHGDLKHSTMVRKLAQVTGLSVHGAHLLALILNFAIIVIALVWAIRKTVPGVMRARNESIQKALQEARKASQEAGQRLVEIEKRLQHMDVELGRIQASAEKEAEAEEGRIKKAAEDEMQKVVQSAKQEIEAAAKQIRRELSVHTADLALALARKQINVDTNTDQVLVRNFAARLAEPGKTDSHGGGGRNGGKDGR
jgi:F-type H+-transporting ATPase subunit b